MKMSNLPITDSIACKDQRENVQIIDNKNYRNYSDIATLLLELF